MAARGARFGAGGPGGGRAGEPDPTRIRFAPDFPARVERLAARCRAARGREAGVGRGADLGVGDEFVGHRPYREGEELRQLDWALLARSERAFVRVFRRELAQRWVVLLDTSASMGLGRPPKLQRAAEVATALAFVGLPSGARATLLTGGAEPLRLGARRSGELHGWIERLEELRAGGGGGLGELLARPELAGAGRVFLIGDLMDLEPARVMPLRRPGRELHLIRLLAPRELGVPEAGAQRAGASSAEGGVRWRDPETGEELGVERDAAVDARYRGALRERLDAWDRLSHRRGGRALTHGVWSTERAFEDVVRGVLAELGAAGGLRAPAGPGRG